MCGGRAITDEPRISLICKVADQGQEQLFDTIDSNRFVASKLVTGGRGYSLDEITYATERVSDARDELLRRGYQFSDVEQEQLDFLEWPEDQEDPMALINRNPPGGSSSPDWMR